MSDTDIVTIVSFLVNIILQTGWHRFERMLGLILGLGLLVHLFGLVLFCLEGFGECVVGQFDVGV